MWGSPPNPSPESPLPLGVSPSVATARIQTAQISIWPGRPHFPLIWLACLNSLDIHSRFWPQRASVRDKKGLPVGK